jgi:hypothetical protein
MLAKDPDGANKLIARAESAGGAADPKIARNIAMMKSLAPQTDTGVAGSTPSPALRIAVAQSPMPQTVAASQTAPFVTALAQPGGAPRPLTPALSGNGVIDPSPLLAPPPAGRAVVMQRVPVDPMAGPVAPRIAAATHAPRALVTPPQQARPETPTAVKTAASEALDLQARADAIAKQLNGKPAAIAAAKAQATRPMATAASKAPTPAPQPAKVAAPAPVKTAAEPSSKDSIPGLRLSANAY